MRERNDIDYLWRILREEATQQTQAEPALASFYHSSILSHDAFEAALAFQIASNLDSDTVPSMLLRDEFTRALQSSPDIAQAARDDIHAYKDRDPACDRFSMPFLYFKGFQATQAHRFAHWLWQHGRQALAYYIQHRAAVLFDVDIHPNASIGSGLMVDHATGLVIGETAVVGRNVSLLHEVTLGGTGCDSGDRHPKVEDDVMISAGAKLLGNIRIGVAAKIGAGSVVVEDVPPGVTVVGVPARLVTRAAK